VSEGYAATREASADKQKVSRLTEPVIGDEVIERTKHDRD
jgi:hypothetical protein